MDHSHAWRITARIHHDGGRTRRRPRQEVWHTTHHGGDVRESHLTRWSNDSDPLLGQQMSDVPGPEVRRHNIQVDEIGLVSRTTEMTRESDRDLGLAIPETTDQYCASEAQRLG